MITQYIIVEGESDKALLEKVLPKDLLSQTKIIVGSGSNIALSKAQSLLVSSELPVTLIVDSDTTDIGSIEEKNDFITQSLHQFASSNRFNVVLATPEIESLFFSNKEITKALIGSKITEQQLELSRYHPKQILLKILNIENIESLYSNLTPSHIKKLRETELIKNIINGYQVAA